MSGPRVTVTVAPWDGTYTVPADTLIAQIRESMRLTDRPPAKPLVLTRSVRELCAITGITPEEMAARMGFNGVAPELKMPTA